MSKAKRKRAKTPVIFVRTDAAMAKFVSAKAAEQKWSIVRYVRALISKEMRKDLRASSATAAQSKEQLDPATSQSEL